MPPHWHLGNDIVDLADPRHTGKAGDERFLKRVFSDEEQEDIRSSENPDRAVWIRWAGKEAAYKTISKQLGTPPTFIHSLFQVAVFGSVGSIAEARSASDPPMTRFGQVRHGDILLPLRMEVAGTALHAVTWTPSPTGDVPPFSWGFNQITERVESWKETLRPGFSSLEWDCVSHQASALARLAARRSMASALGVDEGDLEIGCGPGKPGRRIPKVFLKGEEIPVDLSLSHHGRLLAWAFLTSSHFSGDFRIPAQSQGR
jgi:hypothetical protein